MYCRKCGNKIGDTDLYCQYCGTPTGFREPSSEIGEPEEPREEIIFNPPYDNKFHFAEEDTSEEPRRDEDLEEFISEPVIEEQTDARKGEQNVAREDEQIQGGASGTQNAKSGEFNWNIHEFPAKRKRTDEVDFNWNMEDFGPQKQKESGMPEEKDEEAAAFEEELFREIRDESSRIREQNIDRFFTFSRKNEEFQKLLDREYEKFKMRSEPSHVKAEAEMPQEERSFRNTEAAFENKEEAAFENKEEAAFENKEEAALEYKGEATLEGEEDLRLPFEDEPVGREQISEMALARAQFFGEELILDNESIKRKLNSDESERRLVESGEIESEFPKKITEVPSENPMEEMLEETAETPDAGKLSEVTADIPDAGEFPEETEAGTGWEESGQKRSIGRIVLVVIAIILAVEIIILGIRYFAPESLAAKMINDTQTRIIKVVSGWVDGISDMFSGNDSNNSDNAEGGIEDDDADEEGPDGKQPQGENRPVPDPNPMADKNALVSSQLGNNINIEQVRANEALAYQLGKDYGQADINNSKPVTNNIWQTPENGDPVYYDKAIVGTVIAFDSQWIDYVNDGNKGVLDLVKKGSEAYRKAASFSKVGKIKETFKLLEIGEIRQGADGFYVWTHEEIQITEKGKTTNQTYNWIYYLEPVEGKMQIVNYFKFQ